MLEKNNKNNQIEYCDSHFHYSDCFESHKDVFKNILLENWMGCSCAHSEKEWFVQKELGFYNSFGLHPQTFIDKKVDFNMQLLFLENLLAEGKIDAIGEIGFDFYNEDFKATSDLQDFYFNCQIELALKYNIPVIIHCRKANDRLFLYSKQLKKLPGVLFHSFMGSLVEAQSLCNKGINCYFSFGKQILNNNKNVINIVKNISLEHLLLETDAPYQFLKGEKTTFLYDIKKIYYAAFCLRNNKNINFFEFEQNNDFFNFSCILKNNFLNLLNK